MRHRFANRKLNRTSEHRKALLGKLKTLQNKKNLFSQLQDKSSVNKIIKTLSQRYEKRKGGYSRVIKAGFRYGDDAPLAIIELVDRDVNAKKIDVKKKKEVKPVNPSVSKTKTLEKSFAADHSLPYLMMDLDSFFLDDFYDDEKAVEDFMGTSEEEALKAITNPYSERIDRIRNDNILSSIGRKMGILVDSK